jgi:hypothetical protein
MIVGLREKKDTVFLVPDDDGDGDQEKATGPMTETVDDPLTTKVKRDDFKQALKKAGNNLRKVKLKDHGTRRDR